MFFYFNFNIWPSSFSSWIISIFFGFKIEEIIVYGHSCAIDFDYFSYLNTRYPNAYWKFYVRGAEQESNVWYLIEENSIKNADIIKV